MEYNINSSDLFLRNKMTADALDSLICNLEKNIIEQENQLDLFKQNVTHCKNEISKIEPIIREATSIIRSVSKKDHNNANIKDQIQTAKQVLKEYKGSKEAFEENKMIWNVSGYIALISIDIKTMQKGLYSSTTEWDKRFFARQSYIIMYDAPSKIIRLLALLAERKGYASIKSKIELSISELKAFVDKNGKYISLVRNNVVGHRDNNILEQIDIIEDINWASTIELTNTFEVIINNIGNVLNEGIKCGLNNLDEAFTK